CREVACSAVRAGPAGDEPGEPRLVVCDGNAHRGFQVPDEPESRVTRPARGQRVPYSRSPASPRPGTMKPRSFRPRSIEAQTTVQSGCSLCSRSIPSGAATSDTRRTALAPASFTRPTAAALEL